jgi:hypothetical protein
MSTKVIAEKDKNSILVSGNVVPRAHLDRMLIERLSMFSVNISANDLKFWRARFAFIPQGSNSM